MSTRKNEGDQQNKPVTRYDQKLERRQKKAREDARKNMIFNLSCAGIGLLIIAALAGLFATSSINRNKALKETYVKIGNHEVTKLEYDYYYNMIASNYINSYSSILSYMGLDPYKDFSQQQYTETMTWKDAFDQMAVNQLTNIKAMTDDAGANGFTADVNEDFSQFQANMVTSAGSANRSEADYYKLAFGSYATKENLEPFVRENLLAEAYYNSLTDRFGPSEEEINEYYQENKNNYDKVTYRSFVLSSDAAADASEEQRAEAVKQLKQKADDMAARRKAGEDFNALCFEFAAEGDREKYEDPEVNASLTEKDSYSYVSTAYSDWLFDENRKAEEITVVEGEAGDVCYVVEFVERTLDDTANESIKAALAEEEVNEYVTALMKSYEVVDVTGDLTYLTIPEAVEETAEVTESAEGEAGTEVTEESVTSEADSTTAGEEATESSDGAAAEESSVS